MEEVSQLIMSVQSNHSSNRFKRFFLELNSRILPLPTVLLLFYAFPCVLANALISNIVTGLVIPSSERWCFTTQPVSSEKVSFTVSFFVQIISHLLIPFVGCLSDTKIGRQSAIMLSLWTGWIGCLLQTLSECFQFHSCHEMNMVGRYGLSSLALVFLTLSFAIYYATALAYGMDLLMSYSTTKHRSFIYWFSWIFFLSGNTFSIVEYLSGIQQIESKLSIAFISCFLFSVSLCFLFLLNSTTEYTVIKINPYSKMYKIFKHMLLNQQNHRGGFRSALTYWEENSLSKLDLSKSKYGGIYTHEDVENIKTFFRIVVILLSLSPFWISLDPITNRLNQLVPQFGDGLTDINGFASFVIFYISDGFILLGIPLLEFVVIPMFPKVEYFLINPLKGLGLSQILLSVAVLLTFMIDIAEHLLSKGTVKCFATWTSGDPTFTLNYWILVVPSLISGIADNISFVCVFEFICSQSPYEMNGMLIGLFWVFRSCCISVSSILSFTLKDWNPTHTNDIFSCTSWFLLTLEIISVLGLLLYIPVARWYVKRIRTDELTLRIAVEDHFEQQLIREKEGRETFEDSTM